VRTTSPEAQRLLYNGITVQATAKILGISTEHVLKLGRAGELEIADLRAPGAERGVYRVDPQTVEAFRVRRRLSA
jgi:hypothetical protein